MDIELKELTDKEANNVYCDLFLVFEKFINNDTKIKHLYGDKFDPIKVEENHNKTMNEYFEQGELKKMTFIKLGELLKEYQRLLNLKELGFNVDRYIKETNNIYKFISKEYINDLVNIVKSEVDIFDYHFKYDRHYYTVEMTHDLDSFGLTKNYINSLKDKYKKDFNNLVACEIREFRNYFECNDTKRSLSLIYNIKTNKEIEVLDITLHCLPKADKQIVKQK